MLVLAAWVLVYQEALLGMESIWSRSDTFAHGYFILPISLWLIWRDKAYLMSSEVQSTWLPIPLLAVSLFVGLFAYAADINVLSQLSAVTSLIFLLWSLIGNKLVWRYKFSLAYLLFAVPMGENLIPWLQDVTAWFTVLFLKLNGIPVYVDGLYIQIPTGMFEVAVACSGIRYLIASAAVGALYGYLTYQKTHKQIIFFVFALLLPILANGIRAYGIVAIAYYSDMEYATGADHLVYGWMFFGIIIMLMFWIGGFFADKPSEESDSSNTSDTTHVSSSNSSVLITAVIMPLFVLTFFVANSIPSVELSSNEQATSELNSSWGIDFKNSLYNSQNISAEGIEEYHAVYANKQNKGELVSSQNIFHDIERWTIVGKERLNIDEKPVQLIHLRNINGNERVYLYQYKVGDYYTVNKTQAKLMQAWNSLTRQSDISEFKAISTVNIIDIIQAKKLLASEMSKLKAIDKPLNELLVGDSPVE